MAITKNESQILWAAATSKSVAAAATDTSDAITFDSTDVYGALQISVDNAGTPVSGDLLEVYAAYSCGDILGDTGDDFDTVEHATFIGVLDTYVANTPGEDPARKTLYINTAAKAVKIIVANKSATNAMTVRARLITTRAA